MNPAESDTGDAVRGDPAPARVGADDDLRPSDAYTCRPTRSGMCASDASSTRATTTRVPAIATTPNRFDRVTGVSSGNPPQIGGLTLIRTTAKATLSHYRAGVDCRRRSPVEDRQTVREGRTRAARRSSRPVCDTSTTTDSRFRCHFESALERRRPVRHRGGVRERRADDRQPADAINAGVRFDHSRADQPGPPRALDADGHETEQSSAAWVRCTRGTCSRRASASPIKAHRRRSNDGYAAATARFNQGVLTGEVSAIHPGVDAGDHHGVRRKYRRLHDERFGRRSDDEPAYRYRRCGRRTPTSTRSASSANGGA